MPTDELKQNVCGDCGSRFYSYHCAKCKAAFGLPQYVHFAVCRDCHDRNYAGVSMKVIKKRKK
jgi:DNA-directed RNA polymerase subunit RPC12/RpoP